MKRLFNIVFLMLLTGSSIGQTNLVPNPSFEIKSNCPVFGPEITYASFWYAAQPSPDYFNSCNSNGFADVPVNSYGYQFAYTGNAYAGFAAYIYTDGREYLAVELTDSLVAGKKYCVSFYISLANISQYAVDKIGVYFSADSILSSNNYILPYTPQIETPTGNVYADTANWVLITDTLIAAGGEKFMTIGNFQSDGSTTISSVGPVSGAAYYYIDDVSVVCCDVSTCELPPPAPPTESNITIPNVFSPNGDGINDVFSIETTAIESMSCEIFNRWGVKVATLSQPNEGWDGRTTSGQEALEGVYYYVVRARNEKGEDISKTGFVQLLR